VATEPFTIGLPGEVDEAVVEIAALGAHVGGAELPGGAERRCRRAVDAHPHIAALGARARHAGQGRERLRRGRRGEREHELARGPPPQLVHRQLQRQAKLGVTTRAAAVARAHELGLAETPGSPAPT
jgi:hypothetical protein